MGHEGTGQHATHQVQANTTCIGLLCKNVSAVWVAHPTKDCSGEGGYEGMRARETKMWGRGELKAVRKGQRKMLVRKEEEGVPLSGQALEGSRASGVRSGG